MNISIYSQYFGCMSIRMYIAAQPTVHHRDETCLNFWIGVNSESKYPNKLACKGNFNLKVSE